MTKLSKVCEIEDWQDPQIQSVGPIHRKFWERAQMRRALESAGALRPEAWILAVGAGTEPPVFELTNQVRWVFAIDMYGATAFGEANGNILYDPDRFAPGPYNKRRLIVQFMNALDLRYEDATFDAVFSLSSMEHFGGIEAARKSLEEVSRVLKPGGVAMFATELLVDGSEHASYPDLELFSPRSLSELIAIPDLSPIEPISFSCSSATLRTARRFDDLIAEASHCEWKYPHIVIEHAGHAWTSVSCVLRRI